MTKTELATKLAAELRELADACEKTVSGSPEEVLKARKILQDNTDGYWHGLVVGANQIENLLSDN